MRPTDAASPGQAGREVGADAIRAEARRVLDAFGPVGKGGHVFNLGHGISRFTPPEAVAELVDEVHRHSRSLRG